MSKDLDQYRDIVGDEAIARIYEQAYSIADKYILHINSTHLGGGVAEILNSLVLLMNDVGINAGWRTLHADRDFFTITKNFHHALQGKKIKLSEMKKKVYRGCLEDFSLYTHIDHDCVIVHDPQPLGLIKFYKKRQPWIWRCHIDLSNPDGNVWEYMKTFLLKYDAMIVSTENYRMKLPLPQKIINPSIDPLSPKNKEISDHLIRKYLSKAGTDTDKPIIAQISRFDKWKDPTGIVKIFEVVKKEIDCKLVLMGSIALDDPEGQLMYEKLIRRANKNKDMILIANADQMLVNALQRTASVIIQNSIREGFGLTVSEALWKGTPVVASNVGGIPLQVIDGRNGYLRNPTDIDGMARAIIKLLKNPKLAEEMGKHGRELVRKNFLITRHLLDYIKLLREILK